MKLDVKACAITGALLCGIGLFLITWWVILLDGATGEATVIARVYRGYNISAVGSVIGLLWAAVDGAICGAVIAWVYNYFAGGQSAESAQ